MIKGYIFDYGGTLDTCGMHWGKVLWYAYQRHCVPVTEEQFRKAYVYAERYLGSNPIIKADYTFHKTLDVKLRLELEYLCQNGIWNADGDEFLKVHSELLDDVYSGVLKTTEHSREVLTVLHEKYPMILVSNFYGNVETVVNEFQLGPFFQDIVESASVGIRKPDPRIYKIGVDRLGIRPDETVVVGDSFYKDIEPARKIGCKTIWFKGEGWTDRTYDESIPDKVITDLNEIL